METRCPCCANSAVRPLCHISSIPTMVNQLCESKERSKAVPRGDISLVACNTCGLVWNCDFDSERTSYDAQYDNSQDLGLEYQAHFDCMVEFLSSHVELKKKRVLEVGCGKGRFLTALARETGCIAQGIDPSYLGPDRNEECTFITKPYDYELSQSLGPGTFDCIILRQVFDQLPDPKGMMQNIAYNLCEGGYLYVEGVDFQRLLDERSILDLSYERYTYFTAASLEYIMSCADIRLAAQKTGFQGQYMAVLGQKHSKKSAPSALNEKNPGSLAPWVTEQGLMQSRKKLEGLKKAGKIALWGAANRGVMFCNLLDAKGTQIDCVIDILPKKQGGFLPGSGHPIVAPNEVIKRDIRWVIIANKNYKLEIEAQLKTLGSNAITMTVEQIMAPDL